MFPDLVFVYCNNDATLPAVTFLVDSCFMKVVSGLSGTYFLQTSYDIDVTPGERTGQAVILENEQVLLKVDDRTGSITGLFDKGRSREYLAAGTALPPFRVVLGGAAEEAGYEFSSSSSGNGLALCWKTQGALLRAKVSLLEDGVAFRASLQNEADTCVKAFEYPVIGPLADYGEDGYLAHSYATGVLMRDPLSYLPGEGGLRYAPYPESFSGASMQFFTYYEKDKGGLYFAALDADAHQKWLNAYQDGGGLAASHMTGFERVLAGSLIDMTYDFVVRLTGGKGWQEAARTYKSWALSQPWCAKGTAWNRRDETDWLRGKIGYCTFGVNAGHDRSKWLRRYREDIAAPGFHVLGPDWTNKPQTFGWGVPGDLCDWLPTRFNRDNLDTIRENGDYFAPFEFDFLVSLKGSNPDKLEPHLQRFPNPAFSHDRYAFTMLCPCTGFTKEFHRVRDIAVVKESGADAMYYDISANNLIKICMDGHHGHAPGGGREISAGYAEVYEDTALALRREAGKKVPLGSEMMNEIYLPCLDYYQARAWGQPCSTLETWPFRDQMRSGVMRMIPLFEYVYHEMGAVRMDGWGKLVEETGDLFYYNVAKVYLWGGLYEINHEYSPMEELDGEENSPQEHYFRFDPQHCAYSSGRAAYLKRFAALRTGAGNLYLAYGRMADAPDIRSPETEYRWYHYNHGQKDPSYKASGVFRAEAVVSSAFEDGCGGWAMFLANAGREAHDVTFTLSHKALGLGPGNKSLCLFSGFGEACTATDLSMLRCGEERTVSLSLAPRAPYMLEIK